MTISSEGKARLAKIRSEIAFRRHAELRASGKPARFGELTPERIEAQRNGRLGKYHTEEAKAAIGAGVRSFHQARRKAMCDAIVSQHSAKARSVITWKHGAMVCAIKKERV